MTVAADRPTTRVDIVNGDVRTVQHGRTWAHFRHLQQGFEDSHLIRLFYYDGTIEILMVSRAHEVFKTIIGFLIEFFLCRKRVEFIGTGSARQEKEGVSSAEPDESYEIDGMKLAVEVIFSSGNVSKLKRYKALGVDEVWIWEDGVLAIYHLQKGDYKQVNRSLIPSLYDLDIQVMSKCILVAETSKIAATDILIETYFN